MNKKHALLKSAPMVLCLLSLLALFFPFASETTSVSVFGSSSSSGFSVSGWTAAFASFFGWIMIASPVVRLGSDYIDALKEYKKWIHFLLPPLHILIMILVLSSASLFASVGDISGDVSIQSDVSAQFGFYLMLICQIGLFGLNFAAKLLQTKDQASDT